MVLGTRFATILCRGTLCGSLLLGLGCGSEAVQLRLERAVLDGDLGAVQAALDEGADPSVRVESNLTPLTSAALEGHTEIARLLVEAGAELNPPCGPQTICKSLHHAAEKGNAELTRLLLEAGADPDSRGPYGDVPFLYAMAANQLETARILLEHGFDPDQPNVSGATPFGAICGMGIAEFVPLALANGADLEARSYLASHKNMTPLMLAAVRDHPRVVQLLLEAGADPAALSDSSATARDLAAEAGHQEVVEQLDRASSPPAPNGS